MLPSVIDEFGMFSFFEMTPDLVCIANKEGYFKKLNQSAIDKLGYPENELYSSPIFSFIHPDDVEFTRQKRTGLIEGKAPNKFSE